VLTIAPVTWSQLNRFRNGYDKPRKPKYAPVDDDIRCLQFRIRSRHTELVAKVDWKDFSKWNLFSEGDEQTAYSIVFYVPALKQDVLVVCIFWHFKGQTRPEVLNSTNLEMPVRK
jgi:hypothetical protein